MIKSIEDYRFYIKQDKLYYNHKGLKRVFFPDPIFQCIKTMRKLELFHNSSGCLLWRITARFFALLYHIKYRHLSHKLGFSIPINCFGPGLSIPHYGTIVVNPKAKIGKNCRIHTCVNIGASGGSDNVPKIGDNVYIGPGAILFGDITISDNITIGANATVNKSFLSPNCTIAGTPARIIKENTDNWLAEWQ